jgi:hypothetical protein
MVADESAHKKYLRYDVVKVSFSLPPQDLQKKREAARQLRIDKILRSGGARDSPASPPIVDLVSPPPAPHFGSQSGRATQLDAPVTTGGQRRDSTTTSVAGVWARPMLFRTPPKEYVDTTSVITSRSTSGTSGPSSSASFGASSKDRAGPAATGTWRT